MKTKLGVSAAALAALACIVALMGNYIAMLLIVGYIMIAESDEFLKKVSLKALIVMVGFSVIGVIIGYVPQAIELLHRVFQLFGGYFYPEFISNLIGLINYILMIAESVILLVMALQALQGKSLEMEPVDQFLAAHFGAKECPKCGANLPDGTIYCPNCGEKIGE